MSGLSIQFAPYFPWWVIAVVAIVAGALALYGIMRGVRGSLLRTGAWALLVLALANPSLLQEEREPLKSVVALIVDQSDSQKLDGRNEQTEAARAHIREVLANFPQFEVRETIARNGGADEGDASTALFSALKSTLQDVPPEQVAGAVMITDGQVHDIPDQAAALGFNAPLHALITGKETDRDRRLVIHKAPRFGIVGESQEIIFSVEDTNIDNADCVDVTVLIDGEPFSVERVLPGEQAPFVFSVPHGGKNVIEFEAQDAGGEITLSNNRAFTQMEGIRENLRVLLVSGEPHAGERTWRNLLKSDASVDLVHFTILRPPEKQDGTPISQLSLIAFPTRELFIEKIDEFDLIIFDRYKRRGVLPVLYFDNIARYLTDGGAILIAAGPEHADATSVHRTPLGNVLPAEPTGSISEGPFLPRVSEVGKRHPVTRDLPGLAKSDGEDPDWSRWFRLIESINPRGDVVMEGDGEAPLLLLDRPGEGRVAMLLSDHVWLWARGFEGGGPHSQLLRRLGHWLMKEPELDEEALRATAEGNRITIERQTMGDSPENVIVEAPDGSQSTLSLEDQGNGRWTARLEARTLGLHRVTGGDLKALVSVGPSNPREYAGIVSTTDLLAPIAEETGGAARRVVSDSGSVDLPRVVPVRGSGSTSGANRLGLKSTGASRLIGINQTPLFAGFLGLAILLFALAGMWAREGR